MIALDTNILVRILIDDKAQMSQVKLARQFAEKHQPLFIPQLVQAELVWVLDFSYQLDKSEILHILKHLHQNDAFVLQNEVHFEAALHLFETSNVSFSDCLILKASQEADCQVATFDKRFSKLPQVKLLSI